MYESHPERGINILKELPFISQDILYIVFQHHENCAGGGFPAKLRKHSIHPMAKIVAVADEFCYRTIKNPTHQLMKPIDAIKDMIGISHKNLDQQFLLALGGLFGYIPPMKNSKFI